MASINMLPDEILQKIFEYLPIVDKVKIERVSWHWNRISKQSWSPNKCFSLYSGKWGFHDAWREKLVDSNVARKILDRSGPHVVSIYIFYVRYKGKAAPFFQDPNSATILEYIAKTCPSLQSINVYRVKSTLESYRSFALNCHNLKSVGFIGPMGDKNSLIQLFKNNPNLVNLYIEDNPYFTLKCLKYLNPLTLRWLKVYHCPAFKVKLQCLKSNNLLLRFTSLEAILLNLQQGSISLYCIPRRTLTYFSVRNTKIDDLHAITDARNLRDLHFHTSTINDEILQRVGDYCKKLRSIYIERTDNLTNVGVSKILDLPELEDCSFVDVGRVSYDVLEDRHMKNLKRLVLNGSIQTSYGYSVERLIERSPNLEVVSVMRCGIEGLAAIEFIQRIMAIVERRVKPVSLHLYFVPKYEAKIIAINLFNGAALFVVADFELAKYIKYIIRTLVTIKIRTKNRRTLSMSEKEPIAKKARLD